MVQLKNILQIKLNPNTLSNVYNLKVRFFEVSYCIFACKRTSRTIDKDNKQNVEA